MHSCKEGPFGLITVGRFIVKFAVVGSGQFGMSYCIVIIRERLKIIRINQIHQDSNKEPVNKQYKIEN